LALKVSDDHFITKAWNLPGDGWKNDSVQIFLNPLAGAGMPAEPIRDYWSYGIFFRPEGTSLYVWRYKVPDAQLTEGVTAPRPNTFSDTVDAVCRNIPGGRIYEMKFQPRALMPFQLGAGKILGIDLLFNDADSSDPSQMYRYVFGNEQTLSNDSPRLWPYAVLVP
ncbi:MAG: hypothetical protein PHS41_13560, partial [Victivallaceae bacterium]|nr:hypothetical protein [Victivallaceae bacterium]